MRSYLSLHAYYITPFFAAIAFVASLTIFKDRENPRYLKTFSFFLLINVVTDTVSAIQDTYVINNMVFVNLVTVFDVIFYVYFVREIIRRPLVKKILLYCLIIYPAIFLVNTLLIQGSVVFHSMTYALGCLLIVVSCVYYFWELFQQNYSVNLSRQPAFWISCGLLFYYACTFPFYGTTNLVRALPDVILRNLLVIFILLNILLYLSFTIAFLCRPRNRKSMSSY
jgi:hypothetical protein